MLVRLYINGCFICIYCIILPYLVFMQLRIITGEWEAIQILPLPCSPLIEVALYYVLCAGNTFLTSKVHSILKMKLTVIIECALNSPFV